MVNHIQSSIKELQTLQGLQKHRTAVLVQLFWDSLMADVYFILSPVLISANTHE